MAETAAATGLFQVLGFADDNKARHGLIVDEWQVLGDWRSLEAVQFVVAVGDNTGRARVFQAVQDSGRRFATIVSPGAHISKQAKLGDGTVVLAGAVVQAGASLGQNVIVNAGAVIDHDAVIGNHAHAGPNSTVAGFGNLAERELLGPGCVRVREKT